MDGRQRDNGRSSLNAPKFSFFSFFSLFFFFLFPPTPSHVECVFLPGYSSINWATPQKPANFFCLPTCYFLTKEVCLLSFRKTICLPAVKVMAALFPNTTRYPLIRERSEKERKGENERKKEIRKKERKKEKKERKNERTNERTNE